MGAQHTEAGKQLQYRICFCKTDKVGSQTFAAQEIASLEIEASLSGLHMWISYLESNGLLYVGSFQICQYFDQCKGSIQL